MVVCMIVGIVWVLGWIRFSSRYLVMCATATYYFNSDVEDEGTAEVLLSLQFTHIKQVGTVAFASFAISLIKII